MVDACGSLAVKAGAPFDAGPLRVPARAARRLARFEKSELRRRAGKAGIAIFAGQGLDQCVVKSPPQAGTTSATVRDAVRSCFKAVADYITPARISVRVTGSCDGIGSSTYRAAMPVQVTA